MAVDGRNLGASIYQGSDDYCEFPCTPCSKEERNVAAIKHCEDCDENFCSSCLNDHNKFSAMKGHQMLDKVQSPSGASPQLPKQRCTKHGGKVIDVYCPGHDTVCCSTCIAVEHSTCRGISFIPDVAKNFGTSTELQQFDSKISNLKSRCISLSQSKDTDTKTLEQNKIKLLKDIRDFRKKINEHFDKMERKLVNEADAKFKQKSEKVDDDKKEIQDILEAVTKTEQRLHASKHDNEAELFVLLKSERASIDKNSIIIDKIECTGITNGLKLSVEKKVEKLMTEGYGIGEVEEGYQNIVSSFLGEYDIKVRKDVNTCLISGICLCQDYTFLTDVRNKCLKKLDNNYKVISHLSMPDNTYGVCNVDDKQLAVTLVNHKKVQFVSCTKTMKLQASFDVGDHCRGIEYNNGLFFVCCGGDKKHREGPGHLEIYSISGTLMRSFHDMKEAPRWLSVSREGIYITFFDGGHVGIYETDSGIVQQCRYMQVKGESGICRVRSKLLCITGRESNNIAVITNYGELQQLISTRKENIENPLAICFDEKMSRLIVSSQDSEKLKVFQLNV